ncbi:MAG: hypothetical protein ABI855_15845 [Bacteroidota bacterium]
MSKHKSQELDVDYIGGGRPLTKEDEAAISNFIRSQKAKHMRRHSVTRKVMKTARRKVVT